MVSISTVELFPRTCFLVRFAPAVQEFRRPSESWRQTEARINDDGGVAGLVARFLGFTEHGTIELTAVTSTRDFDERSL